MNKDIISRLYERRISFSDRLKASEYFEDVNSTSELSQVMGQQWKDMEQTEADENLQPIFYKLYHRINREKELRIRKLRKRIIFVSSIAAAILMPVIIISVMFLGDGYNSTVYKPLEIASPMGVKTRFFLPDGSNGWLNGGSKMVFSEEKESGRIVKLEGEAFFDVAKKHNIPFQVEVSDFKVKVLGTRFNVTAYPDDMVSDVVLEKGQVSVLYNDGKLNSSLVPNQRFSYDRKASKASKSNVKASDYISWTHGKIVFSEDSFVRVVEKLKRFYNVDIQIKDSQLNEYSFYGTIDNEKLEDVLDLMELAIPLDYKFEKRSQHDDGTYKKRKVVLSLKKNK